METDEPTTNVRLRGAKSANAPLLPEVDCYLHLLVLLFLMDAGKNQKDMVLCKSAVTPLPTRSLKFTNELSKDAVMHFLASPIDCHFYSGRQKTGRLG